MIYERNPLLVSLNCRLIAIGEAINMEKDQVFYCANLFDECSRNHLFYSLDATLVSCVIKGFEKYVFEDLDHWG